MNEYRLVPSNELVDRRFNGFSETLLTSLVRLLSYYYLIILIVYSKSYIFLDKIIAMTTESTTEKPVVPTLDLEKTESSGSVTKKKSLTKKFAGGLKKIVTPRSRTSSMSSVQSAAETAKEEPVKETYADIAKKAPADEETEAVVEEKAASRLATEGTEAASEAEPVEKKPTHAGTKGVLGGVVAAVVVVAAILLSKGSKKEPEPVVEEKKKKGLFA